MIDQRMEALAAAQHGLVTHRQATRLGLTQKAIDHRRARGRLVRVTRGVYRLAGALDTPRLRALAATLAAGAGSAISHESAAALHGLPGFSVEPLTVTVARSGRRTLAQVRVEQSLQLPAWHLTEVDGIPVTSVARTLFDLCGDVSGRRAERAVDNGLARRLVTIESLRRVHAELAECGRAGTVVLRSILEARVEGYVPPESELEARFIELARRHSLPEPERQVDLGGADGWRGRVDFLYRGARLIVEVDGAVFHDGLLDRRHDADRDARLRAAGWSVLRFRWDDVVNHPAAVAQSIRFGAG